MSGVLTIIGFDVVVMGRPVRPPASRSPKTHRCMIVTVDISIDYCLKRPLEWGWSVLE